MTVEGIDYVKGATVWVYEDGNVRVVPWSNTFGNIQAGRFGCVPDPYEGWTQYVEQ